MNESAVSQSEPLGHVARHPTDELWLVDVGSARITAGGVLRRSALRAVFVTPLAIAMLIAGIVWGEAMGAIGALIVALVAMTSCVLLPIIASRAQMNFLACELAVQPHLDDVARLLRERIESGAAVYGLDAAPLARALARGPLRGLAFRISTSPIDARISPLDLPFEPRLISDASAGAADILAAPSNAAQIHQSSSAASSSIPKNRPSRQILQIAVLVAVLLLIAPVALLAFEHKISNEQLTIGLGVPMFIACVLLVNAIRPLHAEWLVVPGALVLRTPRGIGVRSKVQILRRAESVILATQALGAKAGWMVWAAGSAVSSRRAMSNDELTFLLRAWSSPIDPPAPELLSEMVDA